MSDAQVKADRGEDPVSDDRPAQALGARLADARKQRGWTLREAEHLTGVANAHLSQIETGAIQRPSLDTLVPLAAVYGLPLDEMAEAAGHDVEAIRDLIGGGRVGVITTGPSPEDAPAGPGDGYWAEIAFMGRIEYTGLVTQITKHGQPAYHIDLPEKLFGGNPLGWVEHSASAWFSERPRTEASIRRAWEAAVRAAEKRRQQEAEWDRAARQRALTAAGEADDAGAYEGDYSEYGDDDGD